MGLVLGVDSLDVVSTGCNTKCVFGSVDVGGGVTYHTGISMVRSGN